MTSSFSSYPSATDSFDLDLASNFDFAVRLALQHLVAKIETVADGDNEWKKVIREFYDPFAKTLAEAEESIGNVEIQDEVSDVPCEKCGRMMVYKQGRFGKFLACPGFPECRNTKAITQELGTPCPKCGGEKHALFSD